MYHVEMLFINGNRAHLVYNITIIEIKLPKPAIKHDTC